MPRREPRPFATLGLLLLIALIAAGCAQRQQGQTPTESAQENGTSPTIVNSTNETPSTATLPGFNTTAGQGENPVVLP